MNQVFLTSPQGGGSKKRNGLKLRNPCVCHSGGLVSSAKPDFQAGYEKALNVLVSALTGANASMFQGGLYGEIAAHPLQAILDDDIAGIVGRAEICAHCSLKKTCIYRI